MYIPAIIAGLITFIMTPLVIRIAHRFGAVDVPKDDRRMHKKPMPLWGGIAIFTGFFASMFIFSNITTGKLIGLFVASVVVLITGMIDDVKPLGAKGKLLMQIVAAIILVKSGFEINYFTNFFGKSEFIYLHGLALYNWIVENYTLKEALNPNGLLNAKELVEWRSANSVELCILYTALLRATDIPARMARGINEEGIDYWVETFLNGQWVVSSIAQETQFKFTDLTYFNLERTSFYKDYSIVEQLPF